MQLINLSAIKIVHTSSIVVDPSIETQLRVKPVESGVWDEFLQLQISLATRRSYAAALKDFFGRELETNVSVAAIESFLQLPEREAIGHVLNYCGQLLTAGLAAATVNARLAALRSFVIHAYKRKLCNFRLDDIKSVKAQSYKDTRGISTAARRRASFELFQQLINGIDRSTSMGKRDYAMLRLLWDNNALRRAEVCGLDRR